MIADDATVVAANEAEDGGGGVTLYGATWLGGSITDNRADLGAGIVARIAPRSA